MNENTDVEVTPDDEQERANTIAVRDHRWRNRAEISERQRLAAAAKTPAGKLDRYWQKNRLKLSPDALAALQNQQDKAMAFRFEMDDTIGGIYEGRAAGENLLWPDALLIELTAYLKEFPAVNGIAPTSTAAKLEPEDFDQLEPSFRDYGFSCRIPIWEVHHFRYCVWHWASTHKEDCDADVFAALSSEFDKPAPAPSPSPVGVRTFSRAQEAVQLAQQRDAEIHRRIMEGRRVSDV